MNEKSEVEQFYAAICAKMGITRQWSELHPGEQHQIVMAVNMILAVVHNGA